MRRNDGTRKAKNCATMTRVQFTIRRAYISPTDRQRAQTMHTVARIGLVVLSTLAHAACLIQPIQPPDPPSVDAPASDQGMVRQHVVLRGDNLRGIAAQHGTTPQDLIAANQLEPVLHLHQNTTRIAAGGIQPLSWSLFQSC